MIRILAAALAIAALSGAANAECLPSTKAVWMAHPGTHATWRRIEGRQCWFTIGVQLRQGRGHATEAGGPTRPSLASTHTASVLDRPRSRLVLSSRHSASRRGGPPMIVQRYCPGTQEPGCVDAYPPYGMYTKAAPHQFLFEEFERWQQERQMREMGLPLMSPPPPPMHGRIPSGSLQ